MQCDTCPEQVYCDATTALYTTSAMLPSLPLMRLGCRQTALTLGLFSCDLLSKITSRAVKRGTATSGTDIVAQRPATAPKSRTASQNDPSDRHRPSMQNLLRFIGPAAHRLQYKPDTYTMLSL